ncbi:MAG: T9SS type A sorting domain-containing protein [Paludibacter sp.]|nr:T9SS type A sorting domain-containing protein [Paludibacter sp.]
MKNTLSLLCSTLALVIGCLQRNNHKLAIAFLLFMLFSGLTNAQPLAGTDELGRTLPQNTLVGALDSGKTVAMFYFLWMGHSASATATNYCDLTKIVAAHPSVLNNYTDPYWGQSTPGYYYWGESIYNYYKGDDYWVHLKNVQLLTDAGVDILVLDATNAIHYGQEANALMNAIDALIAQGKNPPKLVFYTNTNSGATMQNIYNDFYKTGAPYRHPNTWYYMISKPLIIGITSESAGKDYASFFTYRESQWPNEAQKTNGWPWIEFQRPQKVYSNSSSQREIVNVSVAQHPNLDVCMGGSAFYSGTGNWGRSYRNGSTGNPAVDLPYGYNVQEQWDYAISQNVPYVFVTGWNEWIVGRWHYPTALDPGQQKSQFVDQASPEYSRDIEPSLTGSLKDNYYMQLVSNVRKYKGVEAATALSASTTISSMANWTSVTPNYFDYIGDVQARNNAGGQPNNLTNIVTVSNYGFETPVIASSPGFVQNPTGGGWTFSGSCGIVKNAGAYGNPTSIEGTQAAYLQQTGYFQQSFSFPTTGTYTFMFSAAQRSGNTQSFDVIVDATTMGTITPSSTSYSEYSVSIAGLTAGNHTIKFLGKSTSDNTAFIDNIIIGIVAADVYTNTTGRNDFQTLKVARDATNLYFYAKTVAAITGSGNDFMNLWLDTDRNATSGWKGYDYKIISSTLQKWVSGAWTNVVAVTKTQSGNELYYTIPRSSLGNIADPLNLEFKWSDNMQGNLDEPLNWYINGDAAPGARFNFVAMSELPLGILNTGFEFPTTATHKYGAFTNGWTFDTQSGIQRNASAWAAPTAPQGSQTAFLQKTGVISESVNFNAGSYKIGFFASQRTGNTQSFQVYYDATLIGTFTPSSSTAWTYYSTNAFTATAGIHTIKFVGTKTTDQTAFIDAVDIVLQTTLTNTGFETPVVSGFQYGPLTNGWTFDAMSGPNRNGSAFGAPTAIEGTQNALIQRTGAIYQDFNFAAGSYKVSFYAAQRSGNTQTINVSCDGVQIGTISPTSSTMFNYYSTNSFTVTAGTHRIMFSGTSVNDNTAFIDKVSLVLGGFKAPELLTKLENLDNEIAIYPNPALSQITLSNVQLNSQISIVTLDGKKVYSMLKKDSEPLNILVNSWQKGVYLVHVHTDKGNIIKKVIVE